MDLNYKTIIEYLSDNNGGTVFPIKKNIMRYSNYFDNKFSSMFSEDFYMYGVQTYDKNRNNISLWSSIIYLLDKKFLIMDNDQQVNFINLIKKQFIEYVKNNYRKFKNKKKFSRNFSMDILLKNEFNPIMLELISFCFDINILIFNFKEEKIFAVNSDEFYNPYKSTILLANYNEYFEPICSKTSKLFTYSNSFLEKILNDEVEYYESEYLDKDFTLVDNLNELYENQSDNNESEESSDNNNMFIKNNSLNLNKTKLRKMKKNEIIQLINEFNYQVNVNQTKDNLINDILMS